jgi:hypothetical protein
LDKNQTKKTISEYTSEIKKLETLVSELQKNCKHENVEIKNVGQSTASIKRICKGCELILGIPTDSELKDAGYI